MAGWVRGVVVGVLAVLCAGIAVNSFVPRPARATSTAHHPLQHTYEVGHGNKIYAYWNRDDQHAPWVINVHGGYWETGSAGRPDLTAWARHEQARGFAAFTVDYRMLPRVSWPTPETDVQTAVRWIRAHAATFGLDLRKGFILGGSAGGLLSTLAALDDGGFAGAVSLAGVVDPYDAYRSDPNPKLRSAALELMHGQPPGPADPDWHASRAMHHLGRHVLPVLLVHSRLDRTVSVHTSRKFARELRAAGYPVQLRVLPGHSHVLRSPKVTALVDSWMDGVLAGQ